MARVRQGDVLITRSTAPSYNALLPLLSGIVTDRGGTLSHAAVVAREYGIPAVVGCGNATELIRDGQRVRLDGARGTVEVLA
jgi:pyruvate,water dikinase